jgi:phosphomannomutase/phosphoglucomutase
MRIPRNIFREYDIRGVADRDLSDGLARGLGRAFAQAIGERDGRAPHIVVGRDGRVSSPRLADAVTAGMLSTGAWVSLLPVGPTPLLYFAAHHLGTDGAMMVTGSHNPAEDNGFKMMRGKASFYGADVQALADALEAAPDLPLEALSGPPQAPVAAPAEHVDPQDAYVEAVRAASRLSRTDVKLVVDAGNGSAGPLGLRTLRALGFDPDPLFCDIDARFPNHHPDPTVPANLVALQERVCATGARVGLAWDGDGDRLGAVDADGTIVWGDRLMILFSRAVLAEHPGAAILGEVKCSQTLYDDIAARGGRPIVWKTGHSLIKTKMKEEHALLAGEMSGHLFFADRWFGFDDAIYASVRLLEILGATGKTLGELLADVPRTVVTPEIRVDCPDAVKFEVVARVRDHFRGTHPVLDVDGARIDFGDGAWGLCRASNTQPVLVLRFEARTEERLAAIRAEVERVVAEAERGPLRELGNPASSATP